MVLERVVGRGPDGRWVCFSRHSTESIVGCLRYERQSAICDLNYRLAISEASVGRSSACKSCKSELRQSVPSDVWSIGWPEEQSRKDPLKDWNLNL
jgi:hypothetical protein